MKQLPVKGEFTQIRENLYFFKQLDSFHKNQCVIVQCHCD